MDFMVLRIIQRWNDNKIISTHTIHITGCMATRILQRTLHQVTDGIKEHTWVMLLQQFSPQDKISGICHLSCSYQAKEADSVKEKTYCSFYFIWPVKSIYKKTRVLMFQKQLSITDRRKKHFLLVTLPHILPQFWNERNHSIPKFIKDWVIQRNIPLRCY